MHCIISIENANGGMRLPFEVTTCNTRGDAITRLRYRTYITDSMLSALNSVGEAHAYLPEYGPVYLAIETCDCTDPFLQHIHCGELDKNPFDGRIGGTYESIIGLIDACLASMHALYRIDTWIDDCQSGWLWHGKAYANNFPVTRMPDYTVTDFEN